MDRLDEIEQRLANATPGEWIGPAYASEAPMTREERAKWLAETLADGDLHLWAVMVPGEDYTTIPAVTGDGPRARANADLIAHAPADLAALVAVVREVAALHQSRPNSTSALYPKPLCTCGVVWENCPTAAAVQKLGEGS